MLRTKLLPRVINVWRTSAPFLSTLARSTDNALLLRQSKSIYDARVRSSISRGLCSQSNAEASKSNVNDQSTSPTSPQAEDGKKLTADEVMANASNRATRYVYMRTLPLAKQEVLSTYNMKDLSAQIEETTKRVCERHLGKVTDDRSVVHLHTTALALSTHQTLLPILKDEERVLNMIRAAFGAPLEVESTMSDEEQLTLNEDQKVRPDYWVVRTALWFAFDKMDAVKRMVTNFVSDFGTSFDSTIQDKVVGGVSQHILTVRKCFYHQLCKDEGLPQVTQVFCALDRNTFSPLNVTKHKIRFTLDKTIAGAADGSSDDEKYCEFKFVRIKEKQE